MVLVVLSRLTLELCTIPKHRITQHTLQVEFDQYITEATRFAR